MNIDTITSLLNDLEAGAITWEQALKAVTVLPKAWQTPEWKQRRDALIGSSCAVCFKQDGPFVLQHLVPTLPFKLVCEQVKAEFRARLRPVVEQQVTPEVVAAHVGPGEKRLACPTCGSLTIRERKTMYPPYICQKCEKYRHPTPWFEAPVTVRYYEKQKTTDRAEALATARPFLVSVATAAELRKHDQAIQHEATLRSLRQTLVYRSLCDTATYCKRCAFKEDLPTIERKRYA